MMPVEEVSRRYFKDQRSLGGQLHMEIWMFARTIDHRPLLSIGTCDCYDFLEFALAKDFDGRLLMQALVRACEEPELHPGIK